MRNCDSTLKLCDRSRRRRRTSRITFSIRARVEPSVSSMSPRGGLGKPEVVPQDLCASERTALVLTLSFVRNSTPTNGGRLRGVFASRCIPCAYVRSRFMSYANNKEVQPRPRETAASAFLPSSARRANWFNAILFASFLPIDLSATAHSQSFQCLVSIRTDVTVVKMITV